MSTREPGVVVAGDEAHAAQPAGHEAVEEAAPVHLSLRQRDGDPEHAALAVLVDPRLQGLLASDCGQDGGIAPPCRYGSSMRTFS
jgi:hypothetical protein